MNNREQITQDRTLLELAAKAAAQDVIWKKGMHQGEPYEGLFDRSTGHVTNWNPLTNDGDALRLAVKLDIEITLFAIHFPVNNTYYTLEFNYEDGEDKYAATRRAIVRAAAEIGKGMKP